MPGNGRAGGKTGRLEKNSGPTDEAISSFYLSPCSRPAPAPGLHWIPKDQVVLLTVIIISLFAAISSSWLDTATAEDSPLLRFHSIEEGRGEGLALVVGQGASCEASGIGLPFPCHPMLLEPPPSPGVSCLVVSWVKQQQQQPR